MPACRTRAGTREGRGRTGVPGVAPGPRSGGGALVRRLAPFLFLVRVVPLAAMDAGTTGLARVGVDAAGLRSTNGFVRVALFDAAEGFPEAIGKARFTATLPITAACARVVFPRVPAGTWAVAVLHDENGNGRMDRGFPGLPREGFAVSGPVRSGPPRFRGASILIRAAETNLQVRMRYY